MIPSPTKPIRLALVAVPETPSAATEDVGFDASGYVPELLDTSLAVISPPSL
jgi:hypothetical protein